MSQPSSDLVDFGSELQPVSAAGTDPGTPAPMAAPVRKQGFTFYTVMLIMSFAFLTVATILLFIAVSKFS